MGLQEIQNERFENSEYWPKQDSEVLKYKGNKSDTWDHFEEPYLRVSVRKENKEGCVAIASVPTYF